MANYLKHDPYREPHAFMADIVEEMKGVFSTHVDSMRSDIAAKLNAVDDAILGLNEATVRPSDVRMQIITEMMRTGAYSSSLIDEADKIAQYVLTGKKPGAEG